MNHQEVSERARRLVRAEGITRDSIRSMNVQPLDEGCNLVVTHERRGSEQSIGFFFNSRAEAEFAKHSLHSGTADVVPVKDNVRTGWGNVREKRFDPSFDVSM